MEEKTNSIPNNMTILEASEFWDSHSVADYPSQVIDMEYDPNDSVTVVAIASDLIEQLEDRAIKSGVTIETLVNLWVQEKLNLA